MTKNVLFDTALDMQMPEVSIQKHPPTPQYDLGVFSPNMIMINKLWIFLLVSIQRMSFHIPFQVEKFPVFFTSYWRIISHDHFDPVSL